MVLEASHSLVRIHQFQLLAVWLVVVILTNKTQQTLDVVAILFQSKWNASCCKFQKMWEFFSSSKLKKKLERIVGVVKVLSHVDFFPRIFFENFQISQSNLSNFNYPQMPEFTKRYLCLLHLNEPIAFEHTPPKMPKLSKRATLIKEY